MKQKEVFVDGDVVYLKKGSWGYRVIHPIKDEKGKIVWVNMLVGGWENFIKLVIILLIIMAFLYGVKEMTAGCRDMAANPCKYIDLDCSNAPTMQDYSNYIDFISGGEKDGEEAGG